MAAKDRKPATDTCLAEQVRRANRSMTALYDKALKPSGLTASQFTLLKTVDESEAGTLGDLAAALGIDRTTLSRNMKPLVRDGLLSARPGEDHRQRVIRVTAKGKRRLRKAVPLWESVHRSVKRKLGTSRTQRLLHELKSLENF